MYKRTHAQELAGIPGLRETVFERADRRVTQRSVIEGVAKQELSEDTKQVLEVGVDAVNKVAANPDAPLTRNERAGLESVIMIMRRPALLIQNGDFAEADDPWKEPLNTARRDIKVRVPSVGRIETVSHGQATVIATGFLVGDGLVMTNTHVVNDIADAYPNDFTKWKLRTGVSPQINFKGEYNLSERRAFEFVDEVIHTHPTHDLALIRIAGGPMPSKLKVASAKPDPANGNNLYVVGYPLVDNEGAIPVAVLKDIFGGHYGYKRLAPGEFTNEFEEEGAFSHDCSTLGGNSGSCVVDLDSGMVVGLHYSGSYLKSNYAVSLWKLKDDPLLSGAGVNFD